MSFHFTGWSSILKYHKENYFCIIPNQIHYPIKKSHNQLLLKEKENKVNQKQDSKWYYHR